MSSYSNLGNRSPYNQKKLGVYGNLGKGENADILFLQTVISASELKHIDLISNIPDSEKWDVRHLFQRDVDDDRVEQDIIPYFKDPTKIKYFSPITLILLPTAEDKKNILKDVDYIEPREFSNPKVGDPSKVIEKQNFYKLNILNLPDPLAELEWNDKLCYLVAIDGQHRLSALKRCINTPDNTGQAFGDWRIPVVILTILKVDKRKDVANLLEIVRKTFVYINTKSERINRAREIILNDESVNAICTQEVINYSHKNDLLPINKRVASALPLIFFDWQGRVINKKQVPGPASLISVEELYTWFYEYLLEEDGRSRQKAELCLADLTPPLEAYGPNKALSNSDALRVRSQFSDIILPGFVYFLENFSPYKKYIEQCRKIEVEAFKKHDNAAHAFMKLRFGTHNAPQGQEKYVNQEFELLRHQFETLQSSTIDDVIKNDIGMRAIIYSLSEIKSRIASKKNIVINWLEFAKEFTPIVNQVYDEGWFKSYKKQSGKLQKFLNYLIFDDAGTIINYKPQQAKDGLGSLLVILIFKKLVGNKKYKVIDDDFEEIWGDYTPNLKKSYEKGLRKMVKAEKQDDWKQGMKKLTEFVKEQADKMASKRLNDFKKYLAP